MAFGAQVPFLIGSIVLVVLFVPDNIGKESDDVVEERTWLEKLQRIDYLGSVLLGLSVGSLLLGFSLKTAARKDDGSEYAWSDPLIMGLFGVFFLATLLFLAVEEWYAAEPVLPLTLLTRRTPAAVAVANLTMAMAIFSLMYNLPLYFEAVRLQPATVAGLHLLPISVFIGAGSLVVGAVMRATGRYYPAMLVSGALVSLSCALLLTWGTHTPEWLTWVAQSPAGFGYAGVLTSTLVALMTNVQKAGRGEIAVATTMTYMARTTGQVLGVALSSAILQATLQADLAANIADPDLILQIRRSTAILPTLPAATREIAVAAYAHGLHRAMSLNLVLSLVSLTAMSCVENEKMPVTAPPADHE